MTKHGLTDPDDWFVPPEASVEWYDKHGTLVDELELHGFFDKMRKWLKQH